MQKYGTHIPVLIKILEITKGPVLELGSGLLSTPLLYWVSNEQARKFISYDNDAAWIKKVGYPIEFTDNWNKTKIDKTHWSLAFLDHRPAERRMVDALRLKDKADFIILHDSEPEADKYYEYEKIYPYFKFRYNYLKFQPGTVILSNFFDIRKQLEQMDFAKSFYETGIKNRLILAKYFGHLGFKRGAEIGVKEGRYSEILFRSIPGLKLYCIDTWPKKEFYETARKRLEPYDATLIKKTSMEAAKEIPDGSLDFVFIDADHKYESVREDVREWTKKVRTGGIISGHDYFVFFYTKNRGVIDAVDEYVKKHGYHLFTTEKDMEVENRDDRPPCWYFYKDK